jgi:hypothetical protein
VELSHRACRTVALASRFIARRAEAASVFKKQASSSVQRDRPFRPSPTPIRWTDSDGYTLEMIHLRTVPLFDPGAQPASWNEHMSPGEYAVHYSSFDKDARGIGPSCTILGSLEDAEEYAKAQVMLNPELRCKIYVDRGFVGPPILEVCGQRYEGESEISPRFRRWFGSLRRISHEHGDQMDMFIDVGSNCSGPRRGFERTIGVFRSNNARLAPPTCLRFFSTSAGL